MDDLIITVHRATQTIGGNCIELRLGEHRLILDVGRPLDAPNDAEGLLPGTLDITVPATVLISHPHQDHFGLLSEVPEDWPVMCGEGTERLMRLTHGLLGRGIEQTVTSWPEREPFTVGPFTVTPFLTDHSAFDAHMLLIEGAGRRVFYSGDFRLHGRKEGLVRRLMESPPPDIDVLLMEGTNIGSDKPTLSEADLEDDFAKLFCQTRGRVFVAWSAQNIDRTVTLYRACLKAKRTLVVDLYTAEVLETLADLGRLPRTGWPNLKVVITRAFQRLYRRKGRGEFVDQMAGHGVSASALAQQRDKWVVMIRPSLMADMNAKGVIPDADDAWCYSQWRGYLDADDGVRLQAWFAEAQVRHLHTSGHASQADLTAFARAINPEVLLPIHGIRWDDEGAELFPRIARLSDGEPLVLEPMKPRTADGFRECARPIEWTEELRDQLLQKASSRATE